MYGSINKFALILSFGIWNLHVLCAHTILKRGCRVYWGEGVFFPFALSLHIWDLLVLCNTQQSGRWTEEVQRPMFLETPQQTLGEMKFCMVLWIKATHTDKPSPSKLNTPVHLEGEFVSLRHPRIDYVITAESYWSLSDNTPCTSGNKNCSSSAIAWDRRIVVLLLNTISLKCFLLLNEEFDWRLVNMRNSSTQQLLDLKDWANIAAAVINKVTPLETILTAW